MLKSIKLIPYLVLLLACASFVFSVKTCQQNRTEAKELKDQLRAMNANIVTYKDEQERWHAERETEAISHIKTLRTIAEYDNQIKATLADLPTVKKSLKNLEYLGIAGIKSGYNVLPTSVKDTLYVVNKDTSKAKINTGIDPEGWYSYRAYVSNNTIQELSFFTNDSIANAVTFKRKWLFGRKRYNQELISYNPNSKIRYSRSIIVRRN
jgi:hypothetical protein